MWIYEIHLLMNPYFVIYFVVNKKRNFFENTFMFFPLGVAFIDFRTEKEWDEAMRKNKLFIGKVYPIDQINLKHFCV